MQAVDQRGREGEPDAGALPRPSARQGPIPKTPRPHVARMGTPPLKKIHLTVHSRIKLQKSCLHLPIPSQFITIFLTILTENKIGTDPELS